MIKNNLELQNQNQVDEIDLKELFRTIAKNKKFIFSFSIFITTLTLIYIYFQPSMFKSSVTIDIEKIELKKNRVANNINLKALAMGNIKSTDTKLSSDIAIMKTFKINKKILQRINFNSRFYDIEHPKKIEIYNPNINIKIHNINIEHQNIKIVFIPKSNKIFELYKYSFFFKNEKIGEFKFNANIKTQYFKIKISKKNNFNSDKKYLIILNNNNRSIFKSIKNNLSIEVDKETNFIEISFTDNIPERGEKYIKYLLYYYKKYFLTKQTISIDHKLKIQKRQLISLSKNLKKKSRNLTNYEIKNNIIEPGTQILNLITKIEDIKHRYIDTFFNKKIVINLIKFVQKDKNIGAISSSLAQLNDKSTIILVQKLEELELEKSTLKLDYKIEHPLLIKNNNKLKLIKNQILANLRSLQSNIEYRIKNLLQLKKKLEKKVSIFPKEKQELLLFNRDYQLSIALSSLIQKNIASLEIDRWNLSLSFHDIEDLYTDLEAIKPKKKLIVIIAFITSLILSIFIVFFREFLKEDQEGDKNKILY